MHIQTWSNNNLNKHQTKRSSKHPGPMQCDRLSVTARSSMCRCQHADGDSAVLALQGFPHSRGPPAKSWHKTAWETKRQTSKCQESQVLLCQVLLLSHSWHETAQGDSKPHSQCRHGIVSRAKGNGTDTPSAKSSKSPPKSWSQAARTHKNMIYSLNLKSVGMQTVIQ